MEMVVVMEKGKVEEMCDKKKNIIIRIILSVLKKNLYVKIALKIFGLVAPIFSRLIGIFKKNKTTTPEFKPNDSLQEQQEPVMLRRRIRVKKRIKLNHEKSKFKDYASFKGRDKKNFLHFSILLRTIGGTLFFIVFEIAFFSLLSSMGSVFYELWLLEISAVSSYAILTCGILSVSKLRIIKYFNVLISFLMLMLTIGLFMVVSCVFESLFTLKIILGAMVLYYALNLYLFARACGVLKSKSLKPLLLVSLLISSKVGTMALIPFLPNTIEIEPKTEPEIVFCCGTSELPTEQKILDTCKKYNIAFMPTIRDYDVGNKLHLLTYKKLIENDINLYFLIGGESNFYAYIDNAREFPIIYEKISEWFISEGIMDDPHVTSFSVNAETPSHVLERITGENLQNATEFGYSNFPTQEEINGATEALLELTSAIKKDGKMSGMVHAPRYLDPADNDGDVSLLTRNIYSLEAKWDYRITMMYRLNQLSETDSDTIKTAFRTFYGAEIEGTTLTISRLFFYQNIGLEQDTGGSSSSEHYIFVGDFAINFKNARYIKEKEYLADFDICRHFNKDKVFFYDLSGFLYHYGWEGIEELGRHAQQKNEWYLKYNNYESMTFLTCYCGLIYIDMLAFLERDLT